MKIKAVCEITGLTSRAVRVYIDENLISPDFKENYLGHRIFDFSESDVETLKSVAVLRKNCFSIDEIREIIYHSEKSTEIIQAVKYRIKQQAEEYRIRLEAFSGIDPYRSYTVSELAKKLSETPNKLPTPIDLPTFSLGKILKAIAVFVLVWSPLFFTFVLFFLDRILFPFAYPKFSVRGIIINCLNLLPSVLFIIVSKLKLNYKKIIIDVKHTKIIKLDFKKIIKSILLGACVISIFFSTIFPVAIVSHSETTDIRNYRKLDADCIANRSATFQDLFPTWPHYFEVVDNETVYLDSKYYYRYIQVFDYTYDIFAEWPLSQDEFVAEVERVEQLFERLKSYEYYNYAEIEKGNYTCLIWYYGDEPFREVTDSYYYVIFAYDEENLRVRYIYCDSMENGANSPYYLQLEW